MTVHAGKCLQYWLYVIQLLVFIGCRAYNIANTVRDADFITSPVIEELGNNSSLSDLLPAQLPEGQNPSYFGYSLQIVSPSNDSFSFVIGSPKVVDPSNATLQSLAESTASQGDIQSCPIQKKFFSGQPIDCDPVNPPNGRSGDNMGLHIPVNADGNTFACTPTRQQDCGAVSYAPGFCYSSTNYGQNWTDNKITQVEECAITSVEVLFVLDGSGSIGSEFSKVRNWVKSITKKLNISDGKVKIGVVQYSHYYPKKPLQNQDFIKTEIAIGEHSTYEEFEAAVNKITLQGYTTYTAAALRKVALDFQATENYGRGDNKQVMILLTDGRADDDTVLPGSAQSVRDLGVTPYAVGVGSIDRRELQIIANGNPRNNTRVFTAKNFNALDKIAKDLQTEIAKFSLEGSTDDLSAEYDMQFGAIGLSGAYGNPPPNVTNVPVTYRGTLYLGAVGAYDWAGNVIKYDSTDDTTADIPKYVDVQKVLPNRTKESYMGYSVTTGYFEADATEYVATGAPRYFLTGAVVIYSTRVSDSKFYNDVTLEARGDNKQLGSYFGGSILSVDLNNDGRDDLLVGAPLYVGSNFDEGRVFVYISPSSGSTLDTWKNPGYEPKVLQGGNLEGGRFGTAIASAGDLNLDGFNDVIVGAPLTEGDAGAVFVYHGGENGIGTKHKQKILASQLSGVSLKYFGQSLQGGVDLDGNKYPDIAVGAPKSDTVVIFRSRPVVEIKASISFKTSEIDIFECINKGYKNCTTIEVCFTASGTSIEDNIGMHYNLTLDSTETATSDKRLEFPKGSGNEIGTPTTTNNITLAKNVEFCNQHVVNMKKTVKDYDKSVTAEVQFDLLPAHIATPLSSVRDPDESTVASSIIGFAKKCGNDSACVHNLHVDVELIVPEPGMNIRGIVGAGNVLLLNENPSPVVVNVNLTNNGENAFDTRVNVTYTSQITLSTISTIAAFPASDSCMVEFADAGDIGNDLKVYTFRYKSTTNIMRPNTWCKFKFNLTTDNLRNNGNLDKFSINVTAFTSDSSSTSSEEDDSDNSRSDSSKIRYRSDFLVNKPLHPGEFPFNMTDKSENITSVRQIGTNTSDITMAFEIKGSGYSNIPKAEISLEWPSHDSHGQDLLYLYAVECNTEGDVQCTCEQGNINRYNFTLEAPNENNTDGNTITVSPSDKPVEEFVYNCNEKPEWNITCETVVCSVENLGELDEIKFSARFRIWTPSILFNGTNTSELQLFSLFKISTEQSPLIINMEGSNLTVKTEQVSTKIKKYEPPEIFKSEDNLWIYILAAVGGLILLIVIVVILWKVGFFKSKYADMKKDAEDDLADETDFQPNENGSTADMMD